MKPWIILIALAVAITAAVTVATPFLAYESVGKSPTAFPAPAKPEGPAPEAKVEGDLVFQFGTYPQQFTGKHAFLFSNTGAGELELRGVSKTCSCTTAELFGSNNEKIVKIQPGESRPIEVTWQTKNNDGHFGQSVTVGTNDPNRPEIILKVEGTVRPAITTMPADPSMNFLTISNDEPATRRIAFWSADRPDIKLTHIATSNPGLLGVETRPLTEEELKSLKAEKGYAIEVTLKPTPKLGSFAEEVQIETDHPMKKELRFKVMGKITGPITATPEKATIRGATSSDGGTESLILWARGRTSVNFVVEKKPQGIDVAIEPLAQPSGAKGSKYKLIVKVIPGTASGLIADEIVLKTDDPKVSELRVPVEVLVQGAN